MSDHNDLMARARQVSGALEEYEFEGAASESPALLNDLADALEAASVERAVVEAQALEQAAEKVAERYAATQVRHESGYEEGYSDALDWAECELRARAIEIREGRQ